MYQKLVLVIRQHNGDDAPQDYPPAYLKLQTFYVVLTVR